MRLFHRCAARVIAVTLASLMLLTTTAAAAGIGRGTITASALRVRQQASTSAATLTMIPQGTTVELLGEEGDWYLTSYNGCTGYIHKDYVEALPAATMDDLAALVVSLVSAQPEEPATAAAQGTKQAVVDLACQYLGIRYRYGGASPSGFDCSGFTMFIYRQFGFSLPHTASGQMGYGVSVSETELQMGDLVFFRDTNITRKAASHVGIYIGGGKFIHASSSSTGRVLISSMREEYFARYYVGARRLISK